MIRHFGFAKNYLPVTAINITGENLVALPTSTLYKPLLIKLIKMIKNYRIAVKNY